MNVTRAIFIFVIVVSAARMHGREPVALTITFTEPAQIRSAYESHLTPHVRTAFEKLRMDRPAISKIAVKINELDDRFGAVYMCIRAAGTGSRPPIEYRFSPAGKLWATMEVMKVAEVPDPVGRTLQEKKVKNDVVWKWTIGGIVHYEAHLDGLKETALVSPEGTYLGQRFAGVWADPT